MLTARNLCKYYRVKDQYGVSQEVRAVDGVSFTLKENFNYALIGESGSGKSTLAKILMGIERASSGELWFDNTNMMAIKRKELQKLRARFQMVLQNSQSALDPRRTVYESIAEPIRCLTAYDRQMERRIILDTADKVHLSQSLLSRLPHELSGGQQQRACIARALSVSPKFIVFDESVSGLDVTVRKQILDLILHLKQDEGSCFLFITHDIDVALYLTQHILVMKEGKVVEQLDRAVSYDDFQHEYSRKLIEALLPKSPPHLRLS